MMENRASIDIGTYTARFLIAGESEIQGRLLPIARKRAYIRLGEGFSHSEGKIIQPESIRRTLEVLKDFLRVIEEFNAHQVFAVTTGVVREAGNRDEFLRLIYEHTGIRVRIITGDTEALLSARGVIYALDPKPGPLLIFDLGGGSTELFFKSKDARVIRSIPLGSMILTRAYLKSDPPEDKQVNALSRYIDELIEESLPELNGIGEDYSIVGTGGTVTTLAAMHYGIALQEINPEKINGLTIKTKDLEAHFNKIKNLIFEERLKLPGLDPERAKVIIAGSLVVIRLLHFFKSLRLSVSLSDLLEGILIDRLEGEKNGKELC